jgi:hypothetical protein
MLGGIQMEPCNPRAAFHEVSIGLRELKRVFKMQFDQLEAQGYFLQDFGCTRSGIDFLPGPAQSSIVEWSEEDLFATIKFLHSHVSKPIKHKLHRRRICGRQRSEFDRDAGRAKLCQMINRALRIYNRGFELLQRGDIIASPRQYFSHPRGNSGRFTTSKSALLADAG